MFEGKISDLKWRVLARLEREHNTLAFSEAVNAYGKHHFYEGKTPFADSVFCVAMVYARKSWQGVLTPCAKKRATHLIVRPHLRWELPEDFTSDSGGIPWLHERFELHVRRFFNAYADVKTRAGKTTHVVGVEIVMSARDICADPGAPIDLWDRAVKSYLARSGHQNEDVAATDAWRLRTALPTRDAAASRWSSGVAFQRRPIRGAAYRWQGGAPCG